MEKPKIFFSYARPDSKFVLKLAKGLKSAGVNVWLDQLDIPAGRPWDLAVQEALDSCERIIVILSPASVDSHNVMDEVSFALEKGKQVVPIVHQSCDIPFRLRRLQQIDFVADYEKGFTQLLTAIGEKTKPSDETEGMRTRSISFSWLRRTFPWRTIALVTLPIVLIGSLIAYVVHLQAQLDSLRETQLSVGKLQKDKDLQTVFIETFPEIANSDWGVQDIVNEETGLEIQYLLVPLSFGETFIIDHVNSLNYRKQTGLLLVVDSLQVSVSVLQDSIAFLKRQTVLKD